MFNKRKYIFDQLEHDHVNEVYHENVNNANMALYDKDFVEFFRKGNIKVKDKNYPIDGLYILTGDIYGEPKIIVIFRNDPFYDVISEEVAVGFNQKSLMQFRTSICFYHIYRLYKDRIKEGTLEITDDIKENVIKLINNFDGHKHDMTPETYYQIHR